MKPGLAAFAALQPVIGALLWLAPGFFYGRSRRRGFHEAPS